MAVGDALAGGDTVRALTVASETVTARHVIASETVRAVAAGQAMTAGGVASGESVSALCVAARQTMAARSTSGTVGAGGGGVVVRLDVKLLQ